jgi:glutathione S-transferase
VQVLTPLLSAAILRYLCTSRAVPDHWYPKDARARARCDAAMDWHHSSLRRGATQLFFVYYMLPLRKGGKFKPGPREEMTATDGLKMLQDALKQMEAYWLASGRFVAGADVSIADLILANEISELDLLAAAPSSPHKAEDLLAPFPRVRAWLADVRRACEPHWDAAHSKLNAIIANSAGGAAKL